MENKFLIMIAAFLLLAGVGISIPFASAQTSLCNPQITLVNQDPSPAIPNSYVKVLFEVSGLDSSNCNGFAVKLNPAYPFSLDPGTDPAQAISGSTFTQNYKTTWMVPYNVRIAADALEGDYQISLLSHLGNSRDFSEAYVNEGFNVTIADALTDFDAVLQEVSGTQISIGIVNTGKNTANSVIVKIPQQNSYRTTGISEQIVGNLAAGDYTIVSFGIAQSMQRNSTNATAFRETMPQAQALKVNIDYTDGIGKRRSIVKEVQLSSSLLQGNSTRTVPASFNRNYRSSGISVWWYVPAAAIILAIAFVIFRKVQRKKAQEKAVHAPDWVAEEKSKGRKQP